MKRVDAGTTLLAVERGDLVVDPGPVDLAGKLHQLVLHIDDLIEPGSEQIAFLCGLALLRTHATLRSTADHGPSPRRIAKNEIARFRHLMASNLAIPKPLPARKSTPVQPLTTSSRATRLDTADHRWRFTQWASTRPRADKQL
jgi:hypothetical protein